MSPGAMGSGLASALGARGSRVVATVAGRSDRTRRLAEASGVELLGSLDEVVTESDLVLSVVPPAEARAAAGSIVASARRLGRTPLVADLNAISPATAAEIESDLFEAGLDLVDGSISGPPPRDGSETRVFLSGERAGELAALVGPGIVWIPVGDDVGAASAVKMSTASVYKGSGALLLQALAAAHANGVLEPVVDDIRRNWPELIEGASPWLQSSAAKAARYVGEMEEIAATQEAAGLTPALFEAIADVYRELARSPLARRAPEDVDRDMPLSDVLDAL
jgi:3-hydroxyisobutyrate dehydrogenase-like beta-hydroxyacid dehydrogenase